MLDPDMGEQDSDTDSDGSLNLTTLTKTKSPILLNEEDPNLPS